jgi:phosphoglycolate phosphatase-like HAD superfamily hydrolase
MTAIVDAQPRILLFDIDGTLLTADGAGRRALSLAFRDVCGRSDAVEGIDFRGMTDALIIEHALRAGPGTTGDCNIQDIYSTYLKHLKRELAKSQSVRTLPGVLSVLDGLREQRNLLAVGLGTGNIEEAAYMKLSRAGLGEYFNFGGFGSDHHTRSELLRIGAARGAKHLGFALADCTVIVIGDTYHDVDAALAIGAQCIGVGTSGKSPAELRLRGARHAFDNLEDPFVIEALCGPS